VKRKKNEKKKLVKLVLNCQIKLDCKEERREGGGGGVMEHE